jgi:asparagine synthase (glutamine-hydrolysing)
MTAVAGFWRFDGKPEAADSCARMLAAQQMYGPHSGAQWSAGDIAIGRRFLRILPEDAFDRQPLIGGGGRYVLVADIRLDNREWLCAELCISEASARQLSDAAILLAAIERWEESCLNRLVGDYAFGLWDAVRRRLLLARDPLGRRPLYYHHESRFFAFASMPKGLHALPEIPYAPDEERVAEFLALLPEAGSRTYFQGIERVDLGHVVTVTASGLNARRYWEPGRREIVLGSPDEYAEGLRHYLDKAVRCRLRGAGNIATHLSGGFDSSAVTATAARLLSSTGRGVVAFTAVPRKGYDGPAPRNRFIDEGPHAAATASLYQNIEHVLVRGEGRSPLDDLDRAFALYELPMLNICNIGWNNGIFDAARERKLTVLFTGDCGNHTLSHSGLELLPELIRGGSWLAWCREARALVARGGMRWRGVLANTFGPWCPAGLWVWLNKLAHAYAFRVTDYSGIHPNRLAELDLPRRAKERGLDLLYRPWSDSFAMRLWALRWGDQGNYVKGALGGWHIDCRDPTADIRLVEFCLGIPSDQFLRNGVQKALARRALSDRLPAMVLNETRKGLQAADWHERLTQVRERVAAELDRLSVCAPASKVLDLRRLRQLVENWPTGGWERDEIMVPYRVALLRALSAGHFLRNATRANV